jgi:citrate synthase
MSTTARLTYKGKNFELPVVTGTEGEVGVDISQLRTESGLITVDDGYGNTGSCISDITFINGEKGILRYRGYPIEQVAEHATFVETAYLIIYGELPNAAQLREFRELMTQNMFIHESMRHHFEGFAPDAPPMAILSAMTNAMGCFAPPLHGPDDEETFKAAAAGLISRLRTIAAMSYRMSRGLPWIYPRYDQSYVGNFLHMMFCMPNMPCDVDPDVVKALRQVLVLHADHEQNCSTSTVRMVGSSLANLHASIAAGICALWGPLHGGANVAVIDMLTRIHDSGESLESYIAKVKDKESGARLMGFGHRVYKNFDPRAQIIKKSADKVLNKMGVKDPLLDLAVRMEEIALKDDYFIERKLYPNVDFYSGIIMRAIGIPLNMFTVMFAIGRLPGWIANWREVRLNPKARIYRPRQIYNGPTEREFVKLEDRT